MQNVHLFVPRCAGNEISVFYRKNVTTTINIIVIIITIL